MSDLGSSTMSETAANNNAAAPDGFPEGMAPSGVNNAAREQMAALKRFWNKINGTVTAGGTANAQTANMSVAEAAYYTGARSLIKIATSNTGPAAININALGAVTILTGGGSALLGGEMQAGAYVEMLHDGTNQRLLNYYHARGSFTPTLVFGTGSATLTNAIGRYERVGNMVWFEIRLTVNSPSTPSGTTAIGALPFAAETLANMRTAVSIWHEKLALDPAVDEDFMGYIATGSTTITLEAARQSTSNSGAGSAFAVAGADLAISGMYRTTA